MSDYTRDQALGQLGRVLCASLARQRGGVWRSVLPDDEGPGDEAVGALTRKVDELPHRDDVDPIGNRPVAGLDHDGLDDAA